MRRKNRLTEHHFMRVRLQGSALIATLALTSATALVITTRLMIATDSVLIDLNSRTNAHTQIALESKLRETENALAHGQYFGTIVETPMELDTHSRVTTLKLDGVLVEYLGCTRLAEVSQAACSVQNTDGVAVHRYRISVATLDNSGGKRHVQSMWHSWERPRLANGNANPSSPGIDPDASVMVDERSPLASGRVSWILY